MDFKLLYFTISIAVICYGKRIDFGYVPNGDNPTLYDAEKDPLLQLDQDTFADTVYNASTAFGIEFYADWCGHCRKFSPKIKTFAEDVKEWKPVVKIAVMNCADPYNDKACGENGIVLYPTLKYFPRWSTGVNDGLEFKELNSSGVVLIDVLVERIEAEYTEHRYPDWPNIELLGDESTYEDLWHGTPYSAQYLAIVFEEKEENYESVKLILDLSKYHQTLAVRRSNFTSKLAQIMKVTQTAVIVFKRDDSVLILNSRIGPDVYHKLENLATTGDTFQFLSTTTTTTMATTTTVAPWSCKRNSEKCKPLYFVSETDMLKAMRYALYNDIPRAGGNFTGRNLTALKDFIHLLANHFPTEQFAYKRIIGSVSNIAKDNSMIFSAKAREFWSEMKDFVDSETANNGNLSAAKWQKIFFKTEKRMGMTNFSSTAKWQHCRGSSKNFRGYTCGLWSTFHALTVHAYLDNIKNATFQPMDILHSIQGWVDNYFGCRTCRDHFMEMTEKTFPVKTAVKRPIDTVLYLWKAHNVVNARLKGDNTEDPEFPKYQFPAAFLCSNCSSKSGTFDDQKVMDFLLNYYTAIKPHNMMEKEDVRATYIP